MSARPRRLPPVSASKSVPCDDGAGGNSRPSSRRISGTASIAAAWAIRQWCDGPTRGRRRLDDAIFGRDAVGGAPRHEGDLPADIVNAQATACGVPEHGSVHDAKDRQPESMPVAIGAQRQIIDEAGENLLVLVALTNEFSDTGSSAAVSGSRASRCRRAISGSAQRWPRRAASRAR